MIVSDLIRLHVISARMWHYPLCQEEIKLCHLYKIFFVLCLVCRIVG